MAKKVWKRAFRVGKLTPAQVARDQELRGMIQAGFPPRVAFEQSARMKKPDYDDPVVEQRWCNEQRANVANYLRSQKVKHRRIGDWPAWHVAPYISIWAIESLARPEWISWWVISGDLPTDYISSAAVKPPQHPRKAIRAIAKRWLKLVGAWKDGRDYKGIQIPGPHSHKELAPVLKKRAALLIEWADDDSLWEKA